LRTQDRHGRPLVFLAVLISHIVLVLIVLRTGRLRISSPADSYEPLILMLLHDPIRAPPEAAPQLVASLPRTSDSNARAAKPELVPDNAITLPPEVPRPPEIDWQREAELAAQNGLADAEKQGNYRNLAGLSPEQLNWIKRNHMQPMPAGIEWTHPRFEFDSHSGLPIYWINDHCVLVTLMVFCAIGKIEANGELFKHMGDAHDP
jgi:hypothetical protein